MNYYNRKYPRLKKFDYGKSGYYHVTICTIKRLPILSKIKLEKRSDGVGCGLAPTSADHASVVLSPLGAIAEEQLMALAERFKGITIVRYVIMPDHIHILIGIDNKVGASPHPTLIDVVRTYKSLVTRICNERSNKKGRVIFQRSFYDTVIWNEEQLQQVSEYISRNPDRWAANTERFGKNKYLYIKE